jgi:hypothetical protein
MRFIPWAAYLYHSAFKNYSVLRVMIDICRGTTELVQHVTYGGSSHRRNVAARHIIDTVWLYCSPISMVWKGGVSNYFYLPSRRHSFTYRTKPVFKTKKCEKELTQGVDFLPYS